MRNIIDVVVVVIVDDKRKTLFKVYLCWLHDVTKTKKIKR